MNSPRLLGFATSMVLHAGVILAIVWGVSRPAPPSLTAAAAPPMSIEVPKPQSVGVPDGDIPVRRRRVPAELRIGEFRFDYRKIAEHPTTLFPFLTRALPLERTTVSIRRADGGTFFSPAAPTRARRAAARPLALSDTALQRLVDKSWSRRERWRAFRPIAVLVTAHGPDDERLLALLRAYRDQNVLQPYVASGDALLWVMLGIAADNGAFIDFVGEYASRHPSSRVTTELLLLLDELAQGSFDALSLLLDTRGHELWWTRESNRDAYDLLVAIQQHYRVQLRKQGVPREMLGAYYDDVRLRILAHIVRTTPAGYRINDALFLRGSIYWNQGRTAEALRAWRQMTVDSEDVYAEASSEIRVALHKTAREDGQDVDAAAIKRILEAEKSRWLASSARRLARFGYSLDTF